MASIEPRPDDRLVVAASAALQEAGLSGLCREGQLEYAVGALREAHPGLSRALIVAAVEQAAAEQDGG